MKHQTRRIVSVLSVPFLALAALIPITAGAQSVNGIIASVVQKNQAGAQSQQRIDQVVDQTQDLLQDYKVVIKELDGLNVYNQLLEKQVENQQKEMASLDESIDKVTVIERQIMPLMVRMIDGLEKFIELDVPFLMEERQKRLEFLQGLLERSDVTVAEKFRRVMEAYQIESDYGRNIEAYRGTLDMEGKEIEVDFLRIGRVALIYQTLDGSRTGTWKKATDTEPGGWEEAPGSFNSPVREGLRIARKQKAPDMLMLPLPAPEDVQ